MSWLKVRKGDRERKLYWMWKLGYLAERAGAAVF